MKTTDLFIDCRQNKAMAALTDCFYTVVGAAALVEDKVAALKTSRGERISNRDREDALAQERERRFEVAYIRVRLANDELFKAVRALHAIVARVRREVIDGDSSKFYMLRPIAKNNVVCALETADAGAALYYETVSKQLNAQSSYNFAVDRAYKKLDEPGEDAREWTLMASGHGSAFRFDEGDGNEPPPPPYMTLAEAKAAADHWCGIADTIGGDAQAYNVRTKQIVR